jgi:hypothetical protein
MAFLSSNPAKKHLAENDFNKGFRILLFYTPKAIRRRSLSLGHDYGEGDVIL